MSSNDIGRDTKKSLIWYTTLPFAVHLFRFAGTIVLARLLSPEDFGVISIVTILFFYCNTFTDFGLANAIVQRKTVERVHYGTAFVFNFIVSTLMVVLFQVFAGNIASFYETPILEPALRVFSVVFLLTSFIVSPLANLRRNLKFKSISIIEAVRVFAMVCLYVVLAKNGYGVWSLIIAMLVAQLINLVLVLFVSEVKFAFSCSLKALKELFSFSMWSFVNLQLIMVSENVEKLILGKVLNIQQLGFFDKGSSLAKMPHDQIGAKVSSVSFSTFSRVKDNRGELNYYFQRIYAVITLISFPVYVGLSLISYEFTIVLLGLKWESMVSVLSIMAFAFLLYSLCSLFASLNMAIGNIKKLVIGRLVLTCLLIIALLQFAHFGIETVALIIVGYNISLLLFAYILAKVPMELSLSKLLEMSIPSVVSTLIMYLSIELVGFIMANSGLGLRLIAFIFTGAFVYGMCVALIPFKSWRFIRNEARTKMPGRLANLIVE